MPESYFLEFSLSVYEKRNNKKGFKNQFLFTSIINILWRTWSALIEKYSYMIISVIYRLYLIKWLYWSHSKIISLKHEKLFCLDRFALDPQFVFKMMFCTNPVIFKISQNLFPSLYGPYLCCLTTHCDLYFVLLQDCCCHSCHRWNRDADLRWWLSQSLCYRHNACSGLCICLCPL